MLIHAIGNCEICGSGKLPFTKQEASCTCKKCGKKFKTCNNCKSKGCPESGRKLESQMDGAAKNRILF